MKKFQVLTKLCIAIIFSLFIVNSEFKTVAYAAGFNLSISPPLIQITIKPGKGLTQVFNIKNNSATEHTLVPRLIPFGPGDELGHSVPLPDSHPDWLDYFSLANSKITLNQPFTLPPGGSDQLVLSLKIPPQVLPADYYVLLSVAGDQTFSDLPASPHVTGGIAANILISVSDQDPPLTELSVQDFQVLTKPLFKLGNMGFYDNSSPISFSAKVKNQGLHLAEIDGFFKVSRYQNPLFTQPLFPSFILAKSQKILLASTSAEMIYHPRFIDIGVLTASIELNTSAGPIETAVPIVFLPIKLLMGIAIITAILLFISKRTLQGY